MTDAPELKPCPVPWCEGDAQYGGIGRIWHYIECSLCGLEGPAHKTEAEAIAAWHDRDMRTKSDAGAVEGVMSLWEVEPASVTAPVDIAELMKAIASLSTQLAASQARAEGLARLLKDVVTDSEAVFDSRWVLEVRNEIADWEKQGG